MNNERQRQQQQQQQQQQQRQVQHVLYAIANFTRLFIVVAHHLRNEALERLAHQHASSSSAMTLPSSSTPPATIGPVAEDGDVPMDPPVPSSFTGHPAGPAQEAPAPSSTTSAQVGADAIMTGPPTVASILDTTAVIPELDVSAASVDAAGVDRSPEPSLGASRHEMELSGSSDAEHMDTDHAVPSASSSRLSMGSSVSSEGPVTPAKKPGTLLDLLDQQTGSKRKRSITHYDGIPIAAVAPPPERAPADRKVSSPQRVRGLGSAMRAMTCDDHGMDDEEEDESDSDDDDDDDDDDDIQIIV